MQIIQDIQQILRQAQQNAYQSINKTMVQAYWLVGKRIIEEEQQGESRAAYGKAVIKSLSDQLRAEFGKGFSIDNLENMRRFYLEYPILQTLPVNLPPNEISETLSRKSETPPFQLSWSHYQMLIRIADKDERSFYEIESAKNDQIFASRYQTILPSKEELKKLLERQHAE